MDLTFFSDENVEGNSAENNGDPVGDEGEEDSRVRMIGAK